MKKTTDGEKITFARKLTQFEITVIILCTLLITSHFISSFFPEERLWGINHLAYFPLELGILLLIVFFLLLIPGINFKVRNTLRIPLELIYNFTFGRSKRLWFVLFSLLSLPLFWVFRTRTHFLGDGYQVIDNLQKGEFFIKWTEPVETLIYVHLYKLLHNLLNVDAATLYELVSCFYGAILILLIFLLVDFLGQDKWEKLFLFPFIALMGSIQLFCGYAEHYSLSYILIFAFIFLSLKYLKGEGNPFLPLLLIVLASFSHVSAFYLLPSVFVLYVLGYQKEKGTPFLENKENWAFLFFVLTTILILLYIREYSWTVGNRYVPVFGGDHYAPGYSLLSWPHILDILNQHLLISPLGFILLISIWACFKVFDFRDKPVVFLSFILLLGLGFNFVMYPGLGMSRDWDLFSSTAIGYTILAGYLFLKVAGKRINWGYLGSVLIITTIFCTLPWVMLNTSQHKTIERFRNLLDLDPQKSRNGHHTLSVYFEERGMTEQSKKENNKLKELFPETDLITSSARYIHDGKIEQGITLVERAIVMNPYYSEAYDRLGRAYCYQGQFDEAAEQFSKAIELYPAKASYYEGLGFAYYMTGRLDESIHNYGKAKKLSPKEFSTYHLHYYQLGRFYTGEGSPERAVQSYKKSLELKSDFVEACHDLAALYFSMDQINEALHYFEKALEIRPDYAPAHYGLGVIYIKKNLHQKAAEHLRQHLRFSEDTTDFRKIRDLLERIEN
ncbi:MAG: tetratricopeptide repeat protein [Candidatus Zixiibacteriota bacterium]